jgi:hypothetical protein
LIPPIQRLVEQLDDAKREERFAHLDRESVAVEGSLLHAVLRMLWAVWLDNQSRAAKLHRQFT